MATSTHRQPSLGQSVLAWSIAVALTAAVTIPAAAQNAPVRSTTAGTASAAPSEDGKPKTTTLSEIKVTAQKRSEYLQDVPITMQTLDQQQLRSAGVHDIKELQVLVPDLQVNSNGSTAQTTARIRGVGTVGDNPGLESSVGVVIDGVPRARNSVGFGDLGEIEQIEVLKGPQGTLFGANTSAGVINVNTKRPSFNEEGYAQFSASNYHGAGVEASYNNVLVKDVAAFRLYAVDRQHQGFNDVRVGAGPRTLTRDYDENFHSLRGQLLITPTNNLDIRVIGDYTQRNENCCTAVTVVRNPGIASLLDTFAGGPGQGIIPKADPSRRLVYSNRNTPQKITDKGLSTEVNWVTPWFNNATFTSITALRQWSAETGNDLDFSTAAIGYQPFGPQDRVRFRTLSQELRLSGNTDKFDWLGGVYFSNEHLQRTAAITLGPAYEPYLSTATLFGIAAALPPGLISTANPQNFLAQSAGLPPGSALVGPASADNWNQDSKSTALFSNVTYHATDALAITAGARYTHAKKDTNFFYNNPNGGIACGAELTTSVARALLARGVPAALIPRLAPTVIGTTCLPWANPLFNGLTASPSFTENELSGTLKVAYRWNEQLLTYLSGARGYKAGGFNLERQQSATGVTGGGSGVIPIKDTAFAPEFVNSYELGAKTTLADGNLLLNTALFYSQFKNFQLNTFSGISYVVRAIPELTTQGFDSSLLWQTRVPGLTLRAGATYTKARYGDQMIDDPVLARLPGSTGSFAPKWAATAGVGYAWDFSSAVMGRFDVGAKYTSKYNTSSQLDPSAVQGTYTLLDARLTVGAINKHWSVELWGKNLTNRLYYQTAFAPPLQTGSQAAFIGAPRTYGVTLRAAL